MYQPKKLFIKKKKDYSQRTSSSKKKGESNLSTGASFSGIFSSEKDVKDVEYFKCQKRVTMLTIVPKSRPKTQKGV